MSAKINQFQVYNWYYITFQLITAIVHFDALTLQMDEGDHSDRSPEFLGAEIDRLKRLLIKEQSFSDFVYCELEKCYNYLDKVIDDIQDEHRSHIDDILDNRTAVEDKSLELSVLRKEIKQEKGMVNKLFNFLRCGSRVYSLTLKPFNPEIFIAQRICRDIVVVW